MALPIWPAGIYVPRRQQFLVRCNINTRSSWNDSGFSGSCPRPTHTLWRRLATIRLFQGRLHIAVFFIPPAAVPGNGSSAPRLAEGCSISGLRKEPDSHLRSSIAKSRHEIRGLVGLLRGKKIGEVRPARLAIYAGSVELFTCSSGALSTEGNVFQVAWYVASSGQFT